MKPATNVALAALLLVALPSAQGRRLNGPLAPEIAGSVHSAVVSPDGARVVFHAEVEVNGQLDLYSAPIGGGAAVRLNPAPVTPGGDVAVDYLVTPDSARVVYRAAQAPNGGFELYSAPIAGGPAIKLNQALGPDAHVLGGNLGISASTGRVVYRAIGNLYSVPIDGSAAPVQLNAGAWFEQVQPDFAISFDGLGVAYRSDATVDDRLDLWVARVDGTLPPQLRAAGPGESDVLEFAFAPGDAHLVYRADHENAGLPDLYSVPVVGGAPTKLDPTLTSGGSVYAYAISPDGASVVYTTNQEDQSGLYSVAIGGGAVTELEPSRLGAFAVGGAAPYRVVYFDDADGDGESDLHSVPLEGGVSSPLSAPDAELLPSEGFELSPDGARVVYRARDLAVSPWHSIYSVPIEGGTVVRLSPSSPHGTIAHIADIAPDSASVVYTANVAGINMHEVWIVPIEGGASTRLSGGRVVSPGAQFDPTGARVVYQSGGVFSVPSSGGLSATISPPGTTPGVAGDVLDFRLHPDGSRAVYLADQNLDGIQELFGVKTSGGAPVRLNAPLAGGVAAFEVSPDWNHVVYRADQDVMAVNRLYGAPLDGGAPVVLDAGPVAGGDVEDFLVSPDSTRVVYRADQDANQLYELFSVPIAGGAVVQLNPALVANGDVSAGQFRVSPDSSRVVYLADQNADEVFELWSVPLAGGAAVRLNSALFVSGDRDVVSFEIAADSSRVVYLADLSNNGRFELWSVPLTGGSSVRLNPTLVGQGDVTSYRLAADSSRVVYRADQEEDEVYELFSVPLAGGAAWQLNGALVAEGDVEAGEGDFAISADSSRVLYRADQEADGVIELYHVPIGGGASVRLNAALPAGRSVSAFQIAPDSTRAVYRADQDTNDVFELYGVELATGTITRLHAPLGPGASTPASGWVVTPDSLHVVVPCDGLVGAGVRLWALPFSGAGPRPVSDPLDVGASHIPIDVRGGRVVYIASHDSVSELFVATLPRPMRDGSVPSGQ